MADNFASIPFPLEGKLLHFRIIYQLVGKAYGPKKLYSLEFDLKYIENTYAKEALSWPSVEGLSAELKRLVLDKVLPLLGKNVQVTGLDMTGGSNSVRVNIYEFGLGARNAATPETSLYFALQPFKKKLSYRLYVKGASLDFANAPLSDPERAAISSFESLFVSVLSLFDGNVLLQYVRNNEFIVSAVFQESVKVSRRAKPPAPKGRQKANNGKG
jgi:hypothetical protein